METYVSLLRGVNMAGRNPIRMKELAAVYEETGLKKVSTYIQSGNVVFTAHRQPAEQLEGSLERTIEKAFGLQIKVFVRTAAQWQQTIAACPFVNSTDGTNIIYVTFLSEEPASLPLPAIERVKISGEEVRLCGRELFFYLPAGYARTRLSNTFFESKLKMSATTRNWRTVNKLTGLLSPVPDK